MRIGTMWLSVLVLTLVACDSGPNAVAPGSFSTGAAALVDKVPGDAFVIAVLDSRKPLWRYLTDGVFLPNKQEIRAALHKELKAFVSWRFGVDVTKVSAAVLFAVPQSGKPPAAGVLVQGVQGVLKGSALSSHGGVKLFELSDDVIYAQHESTLILGSTAAVRAALDVFSGKAKSMSKNNPALAKLVFGHNGGAFVSMAARLEGVAEPGISNLRKQTGIDYVAIRIDKHGIHATATGDGDKMKEGAATLRKKLDQELRNMADLKEKSTHKHAPAIAGIMSIIQYHFMKNLVAMLEPKLSGRRLTLKLPLKLGEQATVLIGFIGVAAAAAIPAFMKYTKKAENSAVSANLSKLYQKVRSYHMVHGRLPDSVGPTPPLGSCCRAGGKCRPSPFGWRGETWRKLGFSIDEPHHYSYSFIKSHNGFTVRANGDLDCDAEYSTFEMHGTFAGGRVPPSAQLYREKPFE